MGQVINATVELTANHKGFFEFRLCPTDNPFERVTHHCLQKFPLVVENTDSTRFMVPTQGPQSKITVPLRLPAEVKCRACLFQWQYTAGNSWGISPDGRQCVGCGNQEQFYGCADIAIGYDGVGLGKPLPKHPWYFQSEKEKEEWHYGVVRYTNTGDETETVAVSSRAASFGFNRIKIRLPGNVFHFPEFWNLILFTFYNLFFQHCVIY